MEIKTILKYCTNQIDAVAFDTTVNDALANGWSLVRREVFAGDTSDLLYAEMAKLSAEEWLEDDQEAPAMTWQEAVNLLRETCKAAPGCGNTCPMFAWCWSCRGERIRPEYWPDPE